MPLTSPRVALVVAVMCDGEPTTNAGPPSSMYVSKLGMVGARYIPTSTTPNAASSSTLWWWNEKESNSDSESELAESSSSVARGLIGSRGGVRVGLAGAAAASWGGVGGGGLFPPSSPRNRILALSVSLCLKLASDERVAGGARARSALLLSKYRRRAAARAGAVAANRSRRAVTAAADAASLSLSEVFFERTSEISHWSWGERQSWLPRSVSLSHVSISAISRASPGVTATPKYLMLLTSPTSSCAPAAAGGWVGV